MAKKKLIRSLRTEGEITCVPLTQGKIAVIDTRYAHLVADVNWYVIAGHKTCYAACHNKGSPRNLRMHHLILPPKAGFVIDHVNGDGLDNREINLRYATHGQNIANAVHSDRRHGNKKGAFRLPNGQWRASITYANRTRHLGQFETEAEAHAAYAAEAVRLHGRFARLE